MGKRQEDLEQEDERRENVFVRLRECRIPGLSDCMKREKGSERYKNS